MNNDKLFALIGDLKAKFESRFHKPSVIYLNRTLFNNLINDDSSLLFQCKSDSKVNTIKGLPVEPMPIYMLPFYTVAVCGVCEEIFFKAVGDVNSTEILLQIHLEILKAEKSLVW